MAGFPEARRPVPSVQRNANMVFSEAHPLVAESLACSRTPGAESLKLVALATNDRERAAALRGLGTAAFATLVQARMACR